MGWENFKRITFRRKKEVPGGLWLKCKGCGNLVYKKKVEEKQHVCPECQYHFTLSASERIKNMLDKGSFKEMHTHLTPTDPLQFKGSKTYKDRLERAQKNTGMKDAGIVGTGNLESRPVAFGITDSRFLMGSMGSVVGEKLARITEHATANRLPLIIVSGSGGGARMDEGMLSLYQMAKTCAALERHDQAGLLYISILTNPVMGGAFASYASVGDINIAEPKAIIGFTGPRVIEQTIRRELPAGFQTSEFLLEHGMIDMIVSRENLKSEIAKILEYCAN